MRQILVSLAAAAALAVTAGAAPAEARDAKCDAAAGQIRAALIGADGDAARTAARRVALGEKLCAANNRRAAMKEFKVAQKALGLGDAAPAAGLASAD
ncbi:MAG TPA: hypothetical protein VGB62_03005 [Allosphingosinicella sp.]|jgi:hypothetical protein